VPRNDIIELEDEHAYVTDLIVLEPFRRSGISAQLMQKAERHAHDAGATRLRVGVLAANTGAHGFYRTLGYEDKEVVLEKQLT
jgi:ribosomal protein S18 acetylase RimI-like enzyme